MTASREIHLVRRPDGIPKPDDFAVVPAVVADPAEGEVLVQNVLMSVDPYMRPRFNGDQALGEALHLDLVGLAAVLREPCGVRGHVRETLDLA